MSIAYDTSSQKTGWISGVGPMTWSHTCTGSNRYLVVAILTGAGETAYVSGVTYNGVSMTQIVTDPGTNHYMFGLLNPTVGANTISVAFSKSVTNIGAFASSYTGVSGYSTSNGVDNASSTSASITVTPTVANSWIVTATRKDGSFTGIAGTAPLTLRQNQASNSLALFDTNSDISNVSTTLTATVTGAASTWSTMCMCLSSAATVVYTPDNRIYFM